MNHVEGKIADLATGEALPPGRRGEICVRGYLVMQGYYGPPELTKEVIDPEGWLHTGDLGVMEEDGNITLEGRIKELIIRGGENISPREIESAISLLPQVKGCKVVGVPDPHYTEEICACITTWGTEALEPEAVREHVSGLLAYYKVPRYILFWDEFPMTPTGKTDISGVKEAARRELFPAS
jgi:fatty-acyl-CoA synthase